MTAQTILPANSVTGGYEVANSLRFNSGSTDYLSITPSSASNRKTFTLSYWVKRSVLGLGVSGANKASFGVYENSSNNFAAMFNVDDQIEMKFKISGANNKLQTNAKFKDISAWYHIVLAVDTTDGTAANRFKLYVNGVQVSSFDTASYPNQDANTEVNLDGLEFRIGEDGNGGNDFDGYMAEICLIDGSQLTAASFGEFDEDSGIWKPINVSGLTFGTNGFYLEFKQAGTSQNSSGMGADTGGEDNHLAVNNLTAVDQSTDTCTNNFATMNPLHFGTTIAAGYSNLTEGNCLFTSTQDGSPYPYYFSTMAVSKGKWYAEFKRVSSTAMIGIATGVADSFLGNNAKDYAMYENGQTFTSGSGSGYGDALDNNDIIGVAMDLDNNKLYFSNQGVFQNSGDPTSGSTGTGALSITAPASNGTGVYHFAVGDSGGGSPVIQCNFGNPIVALSSGNSDADGHGNFEYAVPSGYFALCTKNLAEYG